VQIGRDDASERLARFLDVFPRLAAGRGTNVFARADLRYANGFAIRWLAGRAGPDAPIQTNPSRREAAGAEVDMKHKAEKSLIVGLDVGTSKVVAIVGEYAPGEPVEIIGIGSHRRTGSSAAWWSTSNRPCTRSSARSRRPS
jgi:hypothetical protein